MEDGNWIAATGVENWRVDSEPSFCSLCDAMALGRQQASRLELLNLCFSILSSTLCSVAVSLTL
jgi:hypothetical protein